MNGIFTLEKMRGQYALGELQAPLVVWNHYSCYMLDFENPTFVMAKLVYSESRMVKLVMSFIVCK